MTEGSTDSPPGRDRFSAYLDTLAAHGFHPSKKLGQNFLLDPSLHRVIAEVAAPGPDDLVLEIGPGLGFLTRALAARTRVLAVEIDARLVAVLREEIPTFDGAERVRLLHADVLQKNRLAPAVVAALAEERARQPAGGRFLVVANLPYSVAGPVVMELAVQPEPPAEMVLLIQLEMARRLGAKSGTREYGAMSAYLQLGYDVRFLRKVSAQAFRPRPRVESGIVHLRTSAGGFPGESAAERRAMTEFLRGLFAARRKKLRNAPGISGRDWTDPAIVAALDARPDALDPATLHNLWVASQTAPVPPGPEKTP